MRVIDKLSSSLNRRDEALNVAFALFNEQLLKSPTNQLSMYAEKTVPIVNDKNRTTSLKTLTLSLRDIEQDLKRKRVEKGIKKIGMSKAG